MRPPKRAYIPKTKGCHECSQRRIDCDRNQPNCGKCAARGIRCSGLGRRTRFVPYGASSRLRQQQHSAHHGHSADVKALEYDVSSFEVASKSSSYSIDGEGQGIGRQLRNESQGLRETGRVQPAAIRSKHAACADEDDPEPIFVAPCEAIEASERLLLAYFSQNIAPQLVVIDDESNGWRKIVLAAAYVDVMVRNAVFAAAGPHFSANVSSIFDNCDGERQALEGLRARKELVSLKAEEQQAVVLTLLLLLTGVMVDGRRDFRKVLNLLEAAVRTIGEEELAKGELGTFLMRQVRKFRGYAAPVVSQEMGIAVLSQTALIRPSTSPGWDCFRSYYHLYPALSEPMSLVYDLHEAACHIYIERARRGAGPPMTALVKKFQTSLEDLPEASVGRHALAWAMFLVALESTGKERVWLEEALEKHRARSGFGNLKVVLGYLKETRGVEQTDWTLELPWLQTFIL